MPKRPITAEDLLRIQFIGDPQISPDGSRILFSKRHINEKQAYVGNLFAVDLEGHVQQLTQGEGGASQGRWSPRGDRIAFVSGREEKCSQLFLLPLAGGEAAKVSKLPEGSIGEIKWSPDGQSIAFTFRPTHPDRTKDASKQREKDGKSDPPWELDSAWYRLDGDGYFGGQRHALYILDVESGEHRLLYEEPRLGFISFDWSPNGEEIAVSHTVNKNPWADKPNDQVFRVKVADGQAWQLEGLPKGEKGSLKWSPDGNWIAYIGDHSDDDPWGVRNSKLYVVPAVGDSFRCLTEQDDYCLSVMGLSDTKDAYGYAMLEWSPDSKALYVSIGWHGETQLGYVQMDRAKVEILTKGAHTLTVGNLSRNGERFGCLLGTVTRPSEVAVIDLAQGECPQPKVLTSFNSWLQDEIKLSEPEEFWVEAADGAKVHGWVLRPPDYLAPKRYPAALEIHGGPHAQYGWAFFHEFQLLAARGFVVVYSNPRGSKGYGEAYCAAIRGAWGDRDWEDIQAVTRWMQAQPYIHSGQMGVLGGSYGGYMTNWVIGHTDEFKAAITDRCVSNLVSMGGSSDFATNKDAYWPGCFYGDLETISTLWKQSPIAYFENVSTPTLVIHSEGDLRCNIEQGEQVFAALQMRGIESRFVRYPRSTSHGLSRSGPPDLRLHRLGEIVGWLEKHLKPA